MTGLVLAAFAAMFRRHVALACAVGVVACLTRETAVLATLALALWPGIAPRARVALATIPTVVVAGWSAFLARLFHSSLTALPPGGAVTWPLVGWFQGAASVGDRLLSLVVVAIVLAGGVTRRRLPAPVRAYLLATVALAGVLGAQPHLPLDRPHAGRRARAAAGDLGPDLPTGRPRRRGGHQGSRRCGHRRMTRSIPGSAVCDRHRNALAFTVLAMVLAAGLVGLRVRAFGSVTAPLSIGPRSPAFALVHAEIPHVYTVPEAGHDGAYFYAIA